MSFNKSATSTGSAYAIDGTSTGSLVTSSASASASSEISESDAYDSAYSIASTVAQSVANNNANIINQAVYIVQGYSPVTFGVDAGQYNQGTSSIAIGDGAGNIGQGENSVAIGNSAGNYNQSAYSIAIGYKAGATGQTGNSIILNASGVELNAGTTGFYVKPVRYGGITTNAPVLIYTADTGELTYGTKTFVIDHPINPEKYLVHACLEGPEAGVYYRGEGTICNNHSVEINLPDYVDKLANDFTVQVTPIYDPSITKPLLTSRVVNNKFTVYGENCDFFWSVHGKRVSIEVEPTKSSVDVKGSGPYLWI